MKLAKCFPYRGNISLGLHGLGRFLSQNRATFYACQTSPADRPFRREYNLRKIGGTPETQNRTELSFLTLVTRSRPLQKAEHDCDCEGRTQTHAGRTGRTSDHRPQGHYPAAAAAATPPAEWPDITGRGLSSASLALPPSLVVSPPLR